MLKGKNFYLPELYGMALGLKGNITFGQQFVLVLYKLLGISVFLIKLRPLVFQHHLAVNNVLDEPIAVDLNLGLDPLVAMICLGTR